VSERTYMLATMFSSDGQSGAGLLDHLMFIRATIQQQTYDLITTFASSDTERRSP
jgi:hypothetical protein